MKRMLLVSFIAFLAIGLYGQEKDTAQGEPQIKLELVWEKEIPEGVSDFVFLDENGYNVFSSQCKNPEKALKEKRILMVQDGKLKWLEGDDFRVVKEMPIGEGASANGSKVVISKNGRNIAVIEGLYRPTLKDPDYDDYKGAFRNQPATVRLYNWRGEELASAQLLPGGLDYIYLYPLGNDQTVVVNKVGGEGLYKAMSVFLKSGRLLQKIFSKEGSGIWDYSDDGSTMFCSIGGKGRVVLDAHFKELGSFQYQPNRGNYWAGISPKGNYVAEVTAGKYVVIHDRKGNLIKEHHVQGQGDYYAAFSPDEKYLCVTPGPWRVYFFETETGEMLWEYVQTEADSFSFFFSLTPSNVGITFVGSSRWEPLSVLGSAKQDKTIFSFNKKGSIIGTSEIFTVDSEKAQEFYTWHPTPLLNVTKEGNFLLVRLPSRLLLYHVVKEGGER